MKISFGKKFNERGKYMKYLDLVEKLQKAPENDGNIVMIKNGIFFVGVGKDAIILNNLLGLKLTCMKNELCKVGFQTRSIEKYVKKLQETNKSFVIYNYDRTKNQEYEIIRIKAEPVYEQNKCFNCESCNNKQETTDEIIERIKQNGGIR